MRRAAASLLLLAAALAAAMPRAAAQCASSTTLTASSGTFSDGSGSGNYNNNANCLWIISPPSPTNNIVLSFSDFNLESNYDYVKVYAGSSGSGSALASYTGSGTPDDASFSYSTISVRFTTDGSVTRPGFTASYQRNGAVSLGAGAIAGAVIGSIVGFGFLIGCICCIRQRVAAQRLQQRVLQQQRAAQPAAAPPPPVTVQPQVRPTPAPTPAAAAAAELWSQQKPGRGYGGCKLAGCTLPRQVDPRSDFVQAFCCLEHSQFNPALTGAGTCDLPGCNVARAKDPNSSFVFNYCCLTHDLMDRQRRANQILMPLQPSDYEFMTVQRQYTKKWLKGRPVAFSAVYKVLPPQSLRDRYERYRQSVVSADPAVHNAGGPGNVHRRWHGTSVNCLVGANGNVTPCSDPQCRGCNIVKSGFNIAAVRALNHWARFGPGHYFSATTSKSAEYPLNLGPNQRRVLFLARVVVGRGQKLALNAPSMTGPASGYHSVLGEVGQHLNYDEIVLYNDDAALIAYAIFF